MSGFTYDAGALIAAERNRAAMWALHRSALTQGVICTVPTPVVAQVWRSGSRQANLARLLAGCVAEPLTLEMAKQAGEVTGRVPDCDVVDAIVVVSALSRGDAVVTSDPKDIKALADAAGAELVTIAP